MKKPLLLLMTGAFFAMISCDSSNSGKEKETDVNEDAGRSSSEETVSSKYEIILTPVKKSPGFPDAILEMQSPDENTKLKSGDITFSYDVKNYTLGAQTLDADIKQCANSEKGQHIHLILNNEPYTAHYEAAFEKTLEEGQYVVLSFLSRSYHESLKHYGAYTLRQFTIGNAEVKDVDLSMPHLFYSRPKGEYQGEDIKKLLLDFYLVNTTLSEDGNKVRATINGQTFILTEWLPYFVEGLPVGKHTFGLELIDKDGKLIEGPFNRVERTITLTELRQ